MGTGFTTDVKLVVTMKVRLTGDYALNRDYPSPQALRDYVDRLLHWKLDREPMRLLNVEFEVKEE